MIVFTATLKAKPGKEKELEDALVHMVSEVQNEEGALVYILHRVKNTPGQFTFYEKYINHAALEIHDSTPHMKALLKKLESILYDEIKISHFEEIASISR
ncbi:putative quinol monooxygenase [Bacillus sp. AFS031507]|uniref:putative quinol monooxygenase n=1 Tax=Bacillus sp. AFS031507 TaxID=2033496 RepID=UPI000BFD7B5D|nr:putative quinol monooxygenase [Bacillus sp. AFS031507]PGY11931.1 antibiotic biosynthesis monooxygenase [Bacillus sp. AFS031507]